MPRRRADVRRCCTSLIPSQNRQGVPEHSTPGRHGHGSISSDPAANHGLLHGLAHTHDEIRRESRKNMRWERRWRGGAGVEREKGMKRDTHLARSLLPGGKYRRSRQGCGLVAWSAVWWWAPLGKGGSQICSPRTRFVYPIQIAPFPRDRGVTVSNVHACDSYDDVRVKQVPLLHRF